MEDQIISKTYCGNTRANNKHVEKIKHLINNDSFICLEFQSTSQYTMFAVINIPFSISC